MIFKFNMEVDFRCILRVFSFIMYNFVYPLGCDIDHEYI